MTTDLETRLRELVVSADPIAEGLSGLELMSKVAELRREFLTACDRLTTTQLVRLTVLFYTIDKCVSDALSIDRWKRLG